MVIHLFVGNRFHKTFLTQEAAQDYVDKMGLDCEGYSLYKAELIKTVKSEEERTTNLEVMDLVPRITYEGVVYRHTHNTDSGERYVSEGVEPRRFLSVTLKEVANV